jgi:hypothetical protein
MVKGTVATTDAHCTIERPTRTNMHESVNVALRVNSDGICDSTKTVCFVPLDHDAKEGWTESDDDDRIQLPEAVCTKLDQGSISHVYVSTECVTKVPGMPPCGSWTSAKKTNAPGSPTTGARVLVEPSVVATLPGMGQTCCPLMADGDKLYTCSCASKVAATVFELDPASPTHYASSVASLNPSAMRDSSGFFAAAVHDHMLYWAANDVVQLTPLTNDRFANSLEVKGSVFEAASVLVDADAVYVLASGVVDATGSAVKVVKLTNAGERQVFETGGSQAVYQLDQDANAIYVVSSLDQKPDAAGPTERKSSVVRLDKLTGASTTVLPEARVLLTASVPTQGGYSGVRVDAAAGVVYALFESPRGPDGTVQAQLRRAASGEPAGAPETLSDVTFDPKRTQVRLHGVVDGAVIYSRIDYAEDGKVSSSALLVLPEHQQLPRAVQKLTRDFPITGLGSDTQNIYWLTDSGKLYAFPRSELR